MDYPTKCWSNMKAFNFYDQNLFFLFGVTFLGKIFDLVKLQLADKKNLEAQIRKGGNGKHRINFMEPYALLLLICIIYN